MRRMLFLGLLLYSQSTAEVEAALRTENYDRALSLVEPLLSAKPREGFYYYLKAKAYIGKALQLEEDDPARKNFLQSAKEVIGMGLQKASKNPYLQVATAQIEVLQKNPAATKEALAKAEATAGDDVQALTEIANAYILVGDKFSTDKATQLLTRIRSKDPKNVGVRLSLGDLWMKQGVTELAMQNYEEATQLSPQNPEAFYKLGLAYVREKKINDAANAFKRATELEPSYAPAYRELGELYYLAQRYAQAKEAYQKYIRLRPELPARVRYATFLYLSKDYKAAISEIQNTLRDTFSIVLARLLAYSYTEDGQYDQAIEAFETYFAKTPQARIIAKDYEMRGKALDKIGKDSLAVLDYQKAIQMDPQSTHLYSDMANAYNAYGNYQGAAQALENAIKYHPTLQNYFALGEIYYRLKRYEEAIQKFDYVREKKPDLVEVWLRLGRCHAGLDPESTEGKAKPFYEKVIELSQSDPSKYRAQLIEAYQYLGYYYYNNNAYSESLENYEKLQALDPENTAAKQAIPFLRNQLKRN
ncbi:MAG: tetratricopeptide repeat protein [Bacteroidia bacterium]